MSQPDGYMVKERMLPAKSARTEIVMSRYIEELEKRQEEIQEKICFALQADLENGVAWLNEAASKKFTEEYPELRKALTEIMDMELY